MAMHMLRDERMDAVKAWNLAFISVDPFGWPFPKELEYGRVLFPTDGCHLSNEQFSALAKTAARRGETHCYLAIVEGLEGVTGRGNESIFLVDFSDYKGYADLHITLENCIYSMSGHWGLLLSHEMHGVLGGDCAFISDYNDLDVSAESQWSEFRAQWNENRHKDWVRDISAHLLQGKDAGDNS